MLIGLCETGTDIPWVYVEAGLLARLFCQEKPHFDELGDVWQWDIRSKVDTSSKGPMSGPARR
jgi:hypothetical protein